MKIIKESFQLVLYLAKNIYYIWFPPKNQTILQQEDFEDEETIAYKQRN